jgi:hypothetical protein
MSAQVKNTGDKKAGASTLDITINFPNGGSLTGPQNVPALQRGVTSDTYTAKARIGSSRATGGSAKADSGGAVTETNENNNSVTVGLSLSVGGVAELAGAAGTALRNPGSSGPSASLLAGVVSAGVVVTLGGAAWYVRRRLLRESHLGQET